MRKIIKIQKKEKNEDKQIAFLDIFIKTIIFFHIIIIIFICRARSLQTRFAAEALF